MKEGTAIFVAKNLTDEIKYNATSWFVNQIDTYIDKNREKYGKFLLLIWYKNLNQPEQSLKT